MRLATSSGWWECSNELLTVSGFLYRCFVCESAHLRVFRGAPPERPADVKTLAWPLFSSFLARSQTKAILELAWNAVCMDVVDAPLF